MDYYWKANKDTKIGTVCPDGKIFIKYNEKSQYNSLRVSEKEYLKWITNKLIKEQYRKTKEERWSNLNRTLKKGDSRCDGMIFWRYEKGQYKANFERWVTPQKFEELNDREIKRHLSDGLKRAKNKKRVLEIRKIKELKLPKKEERELIKKTATPKKRKTLTESQKNRYRKLNRENQRKRYAEKKNDPAFKAMRREANRKWNKRRKKTPEQKIASSIRSRVEKCFKRRDVPKHFRYDEYIGCTPQQLVQHIESQFSKGMTWENHGKLWHLDHIRPMASFDLSKKEDQLACSHYTNLQPLLKSENLKKSDEWDGQPEFLHAIL